VNRTDRLVAVLLELQARGQLRAEDLAERFEVSVRTMYRDLEALSESGVPLVAVPGIGYRLLEGYFLPPLSFTASEAGLLMIGGEYVRERVDPELRVAADTALRKLTSVLPAERREAVAGWRRTLLFVQTRRSNDARLQMIREAIENRRVLRLLYHAFRRAEAEQRDVEPFSLVYLAERWQVGAFCRLREGPRLFRLDRIERIDLLGESFVRSDRHTVPPYSTEWKARAPEARVRFDRSVLRWVRERQPFTFAREELDTEGPVFVYAIREERDFVGWLLSWGSAVEVLDPPALRETIAQEAQAIAYRHSEHALATDITLSGAQAQAEVAVLKGGR
jgi:predicted DNA-binding transcriptional regulator YafY